VGRRQPGMATALGSRTSGLRKRIPTSDGPAVVHGLIHVHGSPPLEVRLDVVGGQVPVLADYGNNYSDLPPWYSSGELSCRGLGHGWVCVGTRSSSLRCVAARPVTAEPLQCCCAHAAATRPQPYVDAPGPSPN
jgi:hypothetical protein